MNLLEVSCKKKRGGKLDPDVLIAQFRPSPLLDAVVPDRETKWISPLSRSRSPGLEIELQKFSFLDNPVGTILGLKELASIGCTATNARLHFRDPHCLDIGAYLVLGEVWPCLSPFFSGGHMAAGIQKVMEAVGLRRLMNMRLRAVRDLDDIWAFPVRLRRPFGQHRSDNWIFEAQRDQMAADELCDAIDEWLGIPEPPHELTGEGRAWIATIILELLNNAQRHSDPTTGDGSWAVAAFMAKQKDAGADVFQCHLGILSVGASIDESLNTCAPDTAAELDKYVALHPKAKVSEGTLRTVVALQDGVTRDSAASAHHRGGVGLQDVLDMVNMLGGTGSPGREPRLTIVSGRSCIQLRNPYIVGSRKTDGGPRVLWFNQANAAADPPDNLHVFDLPEHFAGTIISVAFTLDGAYLREKFNDDHRSR